MPGEFELEVERAVLHCSATNHRAGLFILSSSREKAISTAKLALQIWKGVLGKEDARILVTGREELPIEGEFYHLSELRDVLGKTYHALIMDITRGFNPNDIGIGVETVAGSGIVIMISPPLEAYEKPMDYHAEVCDNPEEVKPRFYSRFIRQSLKAGAIIFYDADTDRLLKGFSPGKSPGRGKIVLPEKSLVKRKLLKLCATQSQVDVLNSFNFLLGGGKRAIVITANRGRGKTALLGIATPFIISKLNHRLKRAIRVMVTAPSLDAVQTYFEFLAKALTRQGMRDFFVARKKDRITLINSRFARVEYATPARAIAERNQADVIIVDEASAMAVEVLWSLAESEAKHLIFSATIHGYEGAGRGFSIRFLKKFKEMGEHEILELNLEEPVRYSSGDGIESWLYNVLLLNAKPCELDSRDLEAIKGQEMKLEELSRDLLFEDEQLLRDFFGIYILAHYRNKPSDLLILGDMPGHRAFCVKVNGKIVAALHLAEEGNLDQETIELMLQGVRPKGNITPDVIAKHFADAEFPKLKGLRIVRIAVHPEAMNLGIGSFALKELIKLAKGYDYISASFGVSPELVRFWTKNGFIPVHITPQRNETSGEFTLVVVKPLSKKAEDIIVEHNAELGRRVAEYLSDELRELSPEVALAIFNSLQRDSGIPDPGFGALEAHRLDKYFSDLSFYESIGDIAKPLMRYHFTRREKAELTKKEALLAISKCLQNKSWSEIGYAYGMLTSAIKKVWEWYAKDKLQS